MDGCYLRLYVHENTRVGGSSPGVDPRRRPGLGIRGGSPSGPWRLSAATTSLHEERFFELAGSVTVELDFSRHRRGGRLLLDMLEREQPARVLRAGGRPTSASSVARPPG